MSTAPDPSAARPHLYGLLPEELGAHLLARGVAARPDELRRVLSQTLGLGGMARARRRPVAKALWQAVAAHTDNARLEIVERVEDKADGFVKYLFRHPDGAFSEAVRIPLHRANTYSVCLSSQVGCAMRCLFCATGRLGLSRNLLAWEMVAAFLAVRDDVAGRGGGEGAIGRDDGRPRVTGAVFQGQGEPLHNYDEVIAAARVISHPCGAGISADAITISTVGLVPQIHRYAREGHPYRLIISLTSALADRRAHLLPVAGRFGLDEVAAAIRAYAGACGGRVTIAWVLLGGVNSGADEAEALLRLLPDVPLRINLIDVNDARRPEDGGFTRASDEERRAFLGHLQILRAPIVRRYSGGAGRHAACGMLASVRCADATAEPG